MLVSLDDLQWADPLSIQLLNQIVSSVSGSALALVCLARTEFQSGWANLSCYHRITLSPLSAEDSAALVRQLLKDAKMPGGDNMLNTADGNPFYLTELAQAVAQRGTDRLPATITGLIQERIDRLEPRAPADTGGGLRNRQRLRSAFSAPSKNPRILNRSCTPSAIWS